MILDLIAQFERASANYAAANGVERDADWFLLKLVEEAGELAQVANRISGRSRSKGMSEAELHRLLEDETADLFGHVLLFARHHGVALDDAIERKWRFRPES